MAALSELEERLAGLRRREAELKAALRAVLLQASQPSSAATTRPCTPRMQDVALRVFVLADHQVSAPLKYLRMHDRAAGEADVRDWYAELSPEQQAGLMKAAPGDKLAERRLAEAQKFMAESRLVSWVREQNTKKGLAPTSSLIVEHADRSLFRSKWNKNKLRGVRKCMDRWGGRRAVLGSGEQLPQCEFRQKARVAAQPQSCSLGSIRRMFSFAKCLRFETPISGPQADPEMWVSYLIPYRRPQKKT